MSKGHRKEVLIFTLRNWVTDTGVVTCTLEVYTLGLRLHPFCLRVLGDLVGELGKLSLGRISTIRLA